MSNDVTPKIISALSSVTKVPSDLSVPETVSECYAVQRDTLSAMLEVEGIGGGAAYGWKIGATNQGARDGLGADAPFYGRLLSGGNRNSGDALDYAAMQHAVVEPEFAVQLSGDLPAREAPYSVADVKAATGRVILSIEVVSTRFDSFPGAGVKRYICDNAAAGGWIEGPSSADWIDTDFNEVAVTVEQNGEVVREGSGKAIDDGPFGMLAWLANQGVGLKAGEIITTGTATAPAPANAGDKWVANFGDMGSVEISFG